jgi:DNA-binding NarL/FixJ family response regulator
MSKRVLIVEPDPAMRASLRDSIRSIAEVDESPDFPAARAQMSATSYDLLITNLRLEAYNGLHLVLLAAAAGLPTRSLVYDERQDASLAREAQRAGAFYELRDHLTRTLAAYVQGTLPGTDRRDPFVTDRRSVSRGGRRSVDSAPEVKH